MIKIDNKQNIVDSFGDGYTEVHIIDEDKQPIDIVTVDRKSMVNSNNSNIFKFTLIAIIVFIVVRKIF